MHHSNRPTGRQAGSFKNAERRTRAEAVTDVMGKPRTAVDVMGEPRAAVDVMGDSTPLDDDTDKRPTEGR